MNILITSFGPFQNFQKNPSNIIMKLLERDDYFGKHKMIDFNTIDVCIVLPTKKVASRYMDHFDRK